MVRPRRDFAGISGDSEGLEQLPDGRSCRPWTSTASSSISSGSSKPAIPSRRVTIGRCAHLTEPTAEHIALGRGPCQLRSVCERGCGYGAYFSSLSATLPAAQKTGNLTIVTDAIVERLDYDHAKRRVPAVRVIDANTRQGRIYQARVVFLCASTIATCADPAASHSEYFPDGLANRSDAVGRYLMDHVMGIGAMGTHPGFLDRYYYGRRPTGFYLPRYVNITEKATGSSCAALASRATRAAAAGIAAPTRRAWAPSSSTSCASPGRWEMRLAGFGEMLPRADNRVTLHESRKGQAGASRWSTSTARIGENERRLAERANRDAAQMLARRGFRKHRARLVPSAPPGQAFTRWERRAWAAIRRLPC